MTTEEGYKIGLAALQFFCLEAAEQIRSRSAQGVVSRPVFFAEQRAEDRGCDYFFGVACVFKTYGGALYDRFLSAEEADRLEDFNHRLSLFMENGTAAEWSEIGICEGKTWKRLRVDARRALDQLNEPLPSEVSGFDLESLINPDDFRSSEEVTALLRRESLK